MKKGIYYMYLSVILVCFFSLAGFLSAKLETEKDLVKVENGVIDLSTYQFEKPVSLNGEWEFYPSQLIHPSEFLWQSKEVKYLKVPSPWNDLMMNQGFGYGTYRLKVLLPEDTYLLGLKTEVIRSAYKLYVDGELVHIDGTVGTTPTAHEMRNVPASNYVKHSGGPMEIVIHVSNFDRDIGGITQKVVLGTQDQIQMLSVINYGLDFTGILLLFGFGLYQLSFYFTIKRENGFLYSGLVPIFAGLTTLFRNQKVAAILFDFNDMELFYKLQLVTAAISINFLGLLIYEIGRSKFQSQMIKFFTAISISYSIFTLLVPYRIHSKHEILFWMVVIVANVAMIVSAVREMLKNSWMFHERQIVVSVVVGISFSVLGQMDSILFYFGIRENLLINYLGNLVFIAILTTFYRQKYLMSELRLVKSEQALLQSEVAFLQAQIEPHFVFNALNTIVSFCYTEPLKAAALLRDLSKYLRFTFDHDRFHKKVTLDRELEATKAYLNIEKARFGDLFRVDFQVDEHLSKVEIPFLIIQPLVENAIKHGVSKKEEGGQVNIYIVSVGAQIMISVKDDGVGMLVDATYEHYGVGLKNIKRRMEMIPGAHMHIDSYLGLGTDVQLYLPI